MYWKVRYLDQPYSIQKALFFGKRFYIQKARHFAKSKTIWDTFLYTVWLIEIAHFSVHILLLHHYMCDLAHISDFDSLVIGISKSERWAKNN